MEYESLRTFRANLKTAFDYVEGGAEEGDLTIQRDGTVFKLVLESWQAAEETPKVSPPKQKEESLKKIRPSLGECKAGHMLNKFGNCMQKDCKYA